MPIHFSAAAAAAILAGAQPSQAEVRIFFPEMEIGRATAQHEWPFSVETGRLSCIEMGNQRFVFFTEPPKDDELASVVEARMVVVSTNPLTYFASFEDRTLYAPFADLETLIKRLAPYEVMGRNLCIAAKAKKEN